jgi:hypothetical protein
VRGEYSLGVSLVDGRRAAGELWQRRELRRALPRQWHAPARKALDRTQALARAADDRHACILKDAKLAACMTPGRMVMK